MAPSEPPLGNGGARLPRTHATDNVYDVMLRTVVSEHEYTEDYPYPSFSLNEFCQRFDIKHWEFYYGVYPCIMKSRKHFAYFVMSYVGNNGKYPPERTWYIMLDVMADKRTELPFESNQGYDDRGAKVARRFIVPAWEPKQWIDLVGAGRLSTGLKGKLDMAKWLRETFPIREDIKRVSGLMDEVDRFLHEVDATKLKKSEASEEEENKDSENDEADEES